MEPHGLHPPREISLLFFENSSSLLVHQNGALKLAEVGGFVSGNLNLSDHIVTFVVKMVAFCGDDGVVAGKVEIDE